MSRKITVIKISKQLNMCLINNFKLKNVFSVCRVHQKRLVSALYIAGDKAKENYIPLKPYMDFDETLGGNTDLLKENIEQRHMTINVSQTLMKYNKYLKEHTRIQQLEKDREDVALKIKELVKAEGNDAGSDDLKAQGKRLKNELRKLREQFYVVEDEFIHEFLNLPNKLHSNCPKDSHKKILYISSSVPKIEKSQSHLERRDLIKFLDNDCYYLMDEAAEFDIACTFGLTDYFVRHAHFIQMSNPDFVRRVLLEANATPIDNYHQVIEHQQHNKLNSAFLTGGGSFESFLGAMAKLCVYPTALPLKLVSFGRSYSKTPESPSVASLYTATQSNAVQTFVASATAIEAEQHMEEILNLAVNFYKQLGIPFRVVYANACQLTPSESLRAVIEVYSPAQKEYVCTGYVSNYGDYVSKRLLFAVRNKKEYKFLHLVGGPMLYTTRLIAALVENDIHLKNVKILGSAQESTESNAADKFKSIFT